MAPTGVACRLATVEGEGVAGQVRGEVGEQDQIVSLPEIVLREVREEIPVVIAGDHVRRHEIDLDADLKPVELAPKDGCTEIVLTHTLFQSEEERDGHLQPVFPRPRLPGFGMIAVDQASDESFRHRFVF